MPQGIQVFNADGSVQFDTTNRLLRTLTVVASGTSDGSVTVSGATQGTVVGIALDDPNGVTPEVSSSGTQVNWTFHGAPASSRRSVDIRIAVY